MTEASSGRRYLALWFPFLPVERWRVQEGATRPETPALPLVLIARVKGALRLAAVDEAALGLGLMPGLALADARARVPELVVDEMDEAADRHWLARLARGCGQWSPRVASLPPDGIVIDIAGVGHLFGGEAGLIGEIEEDMGRRGMTVRIAAAESAAAARALARYGTLPVLDERAAVRALPVAALELDDEGLLALRRAGLNTVGEVAARPAGAIAARFGAGAVSALRRLLGEEAAPIKALAPVVRLRFERRFAEPIGHRDAVAGCFAELLREAAGKLGERGLGGRRFRFTLARCDGARQRLEIETGLPTRDPALVMRLLDERIAGLADPLDPGFGYDSIGLTVAVAEPLAAVQPQLEGGEQAEAALAELIDRLSTRLGPEAICRLLPRDSHVPEQAQLALPAIRCPEPEKWPAPEPGEPPLRPLFLFDPPQPVEVLAEVPDGPPRRFRWRRKLHEVRLYEGPERIAAEWWKRRGGEHPGQGGLTRDYYRVEDVRGRRFWIFRHGLYAERQGPRWYLHGLFA